MVVPLLLIARCFSHCVQATERYYELLHELKDKRRAAQLSLVSLVWPGTLRYLHRRLRPVPGCAGANPGHATLRAIHRILGRESSSDQRFLTPVLLSLLPPPQNLEHLLAKGGKGGPVQRRHARAAE